jgi:hypothetical protein
MKKTLILTSLTLALGALTATSGPLNWSANLGVIARNQFHTNAVTVVSPNTVSTNSVNQINSTSIK